MPILLHGLDACTVNVDDKRLLEFMQTRQLMKLLSNTGLCAGEKWTPNVTTATVIIISIMT